MALRDATGAVTQWVGTINDVHDLHAASETLRENEARLRLAIEATGLGTWQIDMPSGAAVWTPEFRAIMGIGPGVAASADLFATLVHDGDRARVEATLRKAAVDLLPYTIVFRLKHARRHNERWIQEWGRPGRSAETGQVRIVGASKDITAEKALDVARASIEERSRLAFHAGQMFAWEWENRIAPRQPLRTGPRRGGNRSGDTNQTCFMDRVHAEDHANVTAFINGVRPLEMRSSSSATIIRTDAPFGSKPGP